MPVVVIVPPVKPLFVATLVTVPVPVTVVHVGLADAPAVVRTWPFVPGAKTTQPEALRYSTSPWTLLIMSSTLDAVRADGTAVPPELFARMELFEIDGSWDNVALPIKSVKFGWVELGTPAVDMVLIH